MKRCPITYEPISPTQQYSKRGLKLLAPKLMSLVPLQFSTKDLRSEALKRVGKMSIQGVQTKLSAKLKISAGKFEIVSIGGRYILKPQSVDYPELPENEAITMTLAASVGINVPLHGLIYGVDGELTYFIKRFDRVGHNKKIAVEDFAQVLQYNREIKYRSSMEKIASALYQYCTFPKIEAIKLFKLTLFNFLIGNEDMHLKNFSLITQKDKVGLSPAYDLLNITILLNGKEEIALPLNGKKNQLRRKDFVDYFAKEKLGLNETVIEQVLADLRRGCEAWPKKIRQSFLSPLMQDKYIQLLTARSRRLGLA